MAANYYPQPLAGVFTPTLTVAALIERLQELPPDLPVVFQTPQFGAFGSNHMYAIYRPVVQDVEAVERDYPASSYIDEESGDEVFVEAWTDSRPAWRGVVIV